MINLIKFTCNLWLEISIAQLLNFLKDDTIVLIFDLRKVTQLYIILRLKIRFFFFFCFFCFYSNKASLLFLQSTLKQLNHLRKQVVLLQFALVRVNKINLIWFNLNNAETSRSPWQKVRRRMRQKRNRPSKKGDIRSHFKQKGHFLLGCLQGSTSVCRVPRGFACGLCLLLASRYGETSNIKTPQDMTTLNFESINHQTRLIYFNTLFGRNDYTQIVQEDIPRDRLAMRKPKRNKVEIQKISPHSGFLPLQPSQTRRRQRIKMG